LVWEVAVELPDFERLLIDAELDVDERDPIDEASLWLELLRSWHGVDWYVTVPSNAGTASAAEAR
jgi:hypothetical protein